MSASSSLTLRRVILPAAAAAASASSFAPGCSDPASKPTRCAWFGGQGGGEGGAGASSGGRSRIPSWSDPEYLSRGSSSPAPSAAAGGDPSSDDVTKRLPGLAAATKELERAKEMLGEKYVSPFERHPCGKHMKAWQGCAIEHMKRKMSDPAVDPKAECMDPLYLDLRQCMKRLEEEKGRDEGEAQFRAKMGEEGYDKWRADKRTIIAAVVGGRENLEIAEEKVLKTQEEADKLLRKREEKKAAGEGAWAGERIDKMDFGGSPQTEGGESGEESNIKNVASVGKKVWWRFGF